MRVDEAAIASPCDEDWDRMHPAADGSRRFCDRCRKDVHDLSALGPEHARALLAAASQPICISYEHREGELVFASPPTPLVPLGRLARAASLSFALAACTAGAPEIAGEIVEEPPLIEQQTVHVEIPASLPTPEPPPQAEPCEPEPEPKPKPERTRGRAVKTAGVFYPL
jgi:outer membrane biosynthesis protein TonB